MIKQLDIVRRLRNHAHYLDDPPMTRTEINHSRLLREAAKEIEDLRSKLQAASEVRRCA